MQTRNKKARITYITYKDFVAEMNHLVRSVSDTYGAIQLSYIRELYTFIQANIVNVYMAEVHDFPEKYTKFAQLIAVIYRKSDEFLHQINADAGKMSGVFDAIQGARAQIFEIAEPVNAPEVYPEVV
jgi:hypothetical protein